MTTLQQRTSRMVWNHLGNARSGRALNLAAVNSTLGLPPETGKRALLD